MASKKLMTAAKHALVLTLVFLIVASPITYGLVNSLPLLKGKVVGGDNKPTLLGQLLHGVVFFLLAMLVLWMLTK